MKEIFICRWCNRNSARTWDQTQQRAQTPGCHRRRRAVERLDLKRHDRLDGLEVHGLELDVDGAGQLGAELHAERRVDVGGDGAEPVE